MLLALRGDPWNLSIQEAFWVTECKGRIRALLGDQVSLATLCRHSCTLQRQTTTKDASGGPVQSFSTIIAGVPCAIQPASPSVREQFARLQQIVEYTVYLTQDIGATTSDRIVDEYGNTYLLVEGGYMAGDPVYPEWPAVAHTRRLT